MTTLGGGGAPHKRKMEIGERTRGNAEGGGAKDGRAGLLSWAKIYLEDAGNMLKLRRMWVLGNTPNGHFLRQKEAETWEV